MSELSQSEREELELLRSQKAAREAQDKKGISFKVSENGAVSVYGLGRIKSNGKNCWAKRKASGPSLRRTNQG